MSILESLQFVKAARINGADPIVSKRARLTDAITQQISIAQAQAAGKEYTVKRSYNEKEGDKVVKKEKDVTPRSWAFQNAGIWYVEIKFGRGQTLKLGDASAITCGKDLKDVIKSLTTVSKAVQAGELDNVLIKAE